MVAYLREESSGLYALSEMMELCLRKGVPGSLFQEVHEGLDSQYPYGKVFRPDRLLGLMASSTLSVDGLLDLSRLAGWKLQGTDGVRALVSPEKYSLQDAFRNFLHKGILSPGFCTLYAQAFIRMLRSSHLPIDTRTIAIAEDGRDFFAKTGLKDALIQGFSSLGVKVEDLGIIPTPFLAAYGLSHGIPAVMLTASHNPAAFNGVKLFIDGRKLYPDGPVGEYCLSWHIADIAAQSGSGIPPLDQCTKMEYQVPSVIESAIQLLDSALPKDFPVHLLQNVPILLDTANGAYSETAQRYFQSKGIPVIPIACTPGADAINYDCGVCELETLPQEVFDTDSLPKTVRALFDIGRCNVSPRMYAVVLDGDGDRGYLLEYCKQSDKVVIYDGDELGYLLAVGMADMVPGDIQAEVAAPLTFRCTIESDFTLADTLQRQISAMVGITCVGDRYLLQDIPTEIPKYVGCEKSGHVIIPVSIPKEDGTGVVQLFSGNGLLTVLFALPKVLAAHANGKPSMRSLHGYRRQFTIRNRPLEQFYRDSVCWSAITELIENELPWKNQQKLFQQEPDMLYYDLFDACASLIGHWVMRKSGTEPKINVNLWIDVAQRELATKIMRNLDEMISDMLV